MKDKNERQHSLPWEIATMFSMIEGGLKDDNKEDKKKVYPKDKE